nr:hypothetical protein [Desulfobulbaceae bacterium]
MRRFFISFLTLVAFLTTFATAAYSHGGGHVPANPVTKDVALQNATEAFNSLVQNGQLGNSWANIKPSGAKKEKFQYSDEWVVAFTNPKEEDTKKQTLYVFLTLAGEFITANFLGQ